MAQHRQSGTERYGARASHDLHHHSNGSTDHIALGIRSGSYMQGRTRRSGRSDKGLFGVSIGAIIVVLSLVLGVTVLAYYFLSRDSGEISSYHAEDDDLKSDFLSNVTRKVVEFGHSSVVHGGDSRYWDKDDRRRDEDYNEDVIEHSGKDSTDEATVKDVVLVKDKNVEKKYALDGSSVKGSDRRSVGLYNEAGRNELKMYEAEYEASLKNSGTSIEDGVHQNQQFDEHLEKRNEAVDGIDEYDDGIDYHDAHVDEYDDARYEEEDHFDVGESDHKDGRKSFGLLDTETNDQNTAEKVEDASNKSFEKNSRNLDEIGTNSRHVSISDGQSARRSKADSKRKGKRHKFSGASCQMKFLNSTAQLVEPPENRKFARFTLQYTEIENPDGQQQWEPRFAGHQSLRERENSFLARDQKINCGFVRGPKGSPSTGFDLSEDDESYISRCHIAVISCIFGNSDRLRTPAGKTVTRLSRKNVCFVVFIDELTLETLSSEGQTPDRTGFIGLWRIVVVKNLPYADMRRVGKIPKLLPHRLFPSARYSIWLDSKLRLQLDPLLILEYFLWRKGYEFAISNHYDRHCVWQEVAQNKKLNKYNHTIIDQQFEFYQADGLTRFNASDPNKLLPSNVPEGSFIIRAHTPMSNLFSCLWFNEVERFTPRDQLSFAYTYQKLTRMNPGRPFHLSMFKDCERRSIAKLFHHRSDEKRRHKAAE
ncbi:hypothetical protein FNV43_RR10577 [Rhamnella rubrinervis]|uniref:TOD1/MUCI70 glycosyltransferase-like domain-containing protein n=1 Tax=Rhamnella rubrinervis TaxID=2594499 RepID=A0A8K0MGV0_9ROSA|nr:hypothetical protein FNV43_RR10577 [Rhamnella rubrinervis]